MEPVEMRTEGLLLRPWRPGDPAPVRVDRPATVRNHAARSTGLPPGPMIGVPPGVSGRSEEGIAAPVPREPTAPGRELAACVRRQAATGRDRPTPAAGPVPLRPPDERDIAAHRDPRVVRWYGVPSTSTHADVRTPSPQSTPHRWALGAAAVVVTGPDNARAGTIGRRIGDRDPEVGEVAPLRSAHTDDDRRRDCRAGSIVADEVAA